MIPLPRMLARFKSARTTVPAGADETTYQPTPDMESHVGRVTVECEVISRPATDMDNDLVTRCREAVDYSPNLASGHIRLGLALLECGQYAESTTSLSYATRLGKDGGLSGADCALAHAALGAALTAFNNGSLTEALPEFRRAQHFLSQMREFAPPRLRQALRFFRHGDFAQAIPMLNETVCPEHEAELFGTDPALAHCTLGCALIAQEPANETVARVEFEQTFVHLRRTFKVE